jgi:hypothetical protein
VSEERQNTPPLYQEDLEKLLKEALLVKEALMVDEREQVDTISLYRKVKEAFNSGILDISYCDITESFDLANLVFASHSAVAEDDFKEWLKSHPFGSRSRVKGEIVEIPFEFKATDTTFQKESAFVSITFQRDASFSRATFEGTASFHSIPFERRVSFHFATFQKDAYFLRTTFQKEGGFDWATFQEGVYFSETSFQEELSFEKATFEKETNFTNVIFKQQTCFKEIEIAKTATLNFDHITTHDYFGIIPSVFKGEIIIKDPTLESDKRPLVIDLENCSPESKGTVSFENIEMDEKKTCIKLRNLKSDSGVKVHFTDCSFFGENVVLRHVDFEKINIEGGTLAKGFDFGYLDPTPQTITLGCLGFPINCQFQAIHKNKKLPENKLKMWASIYANLKAKADEKGERQLGNDYFFWQQYLQKKEHRPLFFNFNEIYLRSSAYGLNVSLPCWYFLAFFFSFSLLYMIDLHSFTESNLVSLSASVPFVFNDVEVIKQKVELIATQENWWFYPLYIVQHLIQGYLLFQIGAAIRNKVKR